MTISQGKHHRLRQLRRKYPNCAPFIQLGPDPACPWCGGRGEETLHWAEIGETWQAPCWCIMASHDPRLTLMAQPGRPGHFAWVLLGEAQLNRLEFGPDVGHLLA